MLRRPSTLDFLAAPQTPRAILIGSVSSIPAKFRRRVWQRLFRCSPEATTLYPFLPNPLSASQAQITSFIGTGYGDLFNRAPDPSGLAYWSHQLPANLGNPQAVGDFILAVIFGAQGTDQTTIGSKVTVANFFTQELEACHSLRLQTRSPIAPLVQ